MSGTGAYVAGGRWNPPGHRMIYSSSNLALALLELLVHVDDAVSFQRMPHVYHEISFPADAVSFLLEADLPAGWDQRPESLAAQLAGEDWLTSQTSAILGVPSVIMPPPHRYQPEYLNYLMNPEHPKFSELVQAHEVLPLSFDSRLHS